MEQLAERFLTILEVSQKQAYIFASNKLRDNIVNSEIIAYALSPEYIQKELASFGYSDEANMVYSGGGHTILEFDSTEKARACVSALTEKIYRDFDGLEVFSKIVKYDSIKSVQDNLKELTKELERKKAERLSAFKQGSYGVEKTDTNTLNVIPLGTPSEEKNKIADSKEIQNREQGYYPHGYEAVTAFGELGGSKGEKNFIAVVHIDGNGMGTRVEELYKREDIKTAEWSAVKNKLREFSEGIDRDFKDTLKETAEVIAEAFGKGILSNLDYKINEKTGAILFPLRRVITAGDDICFVTEGRIGIECAAIFLKKLSKKKNTIDGKNYCASAGVAIVHQKYPFYKAYELAEMLCSNAKKYGAVVSPEDNGRSVGVIDWHIEYGELKDDMTEIRRQYLTEDGKHMELRPYIVTAPETIMENEKLKDSLYSSFKTRMKILEKEAGKYPTGKLKELRGAMRSGDTETKNYLTFNRMEELAVDVCLLLDTSRLFSGRESSYSLFAKQADGEDHSLLFDAIETMDVFVPLDGEE